MAAFHAGVPVLRPAARGSQDHSRLIFNDSEEIVFKYFGRKLGGAAISSLGYFPPRPRVA
jgi:hypothetical protein